LVKSETFLHTRACDQGAYQDFQLKPHWTMPKSAPTRLVDAKVCVAFVGQAMAMQLVLRLRIRAAIQPAFVNLRRSNVVVRMVSLPHGKVQVHWLVP
jgi:hypothetical protein